LTVSNKRDCRPPGWLRRFHRPVVRIAGACGIFLILAACSSVSHVIADNWPHMLGGLPEGVPARPETQPAYMPISEPPPARDTKKMTAEERAKYEAELAASRTQNTTQGEELKSQAPAPLPPIH
jgi:hypothetical protein